MCILEEMQWIRTRPVHASDFFHGTLELVEPGVSVSCSRARTPPGPSSTGWSASPPGSPTSCGARRGRRGAARDLAGHACARRRPVVLAALLERVSAHLEVLRDHPLTTRRYYKPHGVLMDALMTVDPAHRRRQRRRPLPRAGRASTPAGTRSTWRCTRAGAAPARHTSVRLAPTRPAALCSTRCVAEGVDTPCCGSWRAPTPMPDVQRRRRQPGLRSRGPRACRGSRSRRGPRSRCGRDVVHTGECSMVEDQLPTSPRPRDGSPSTSRSARGPTSRSTHRYVDIAIRSLPGATAEEAGAQAERIRPSARRRGGHPGRRGCGGSRARGVATPGPNHSGRRHPRSRGRLHRPLPASGSTGGEPPATLARRATAYATSTCATFGAFGYETALEATTTHR